VLVLQVDLLGSRDVIGHMTIQFPIGHFLLVVCWNKTSLCNGFRDVEYRMWRPLNKGQGHSFWYQSISQIWLPTGCQ